MSALCLHCVTGKSRFRTEKPFSNALCLYNETSESFFQHTPETRFKARAFVFAIFGKRGGGNTIESVPCPFFLFRAVPVLKALLCFFSASNFAALNFYRYFALKRFIKNGVPMAIYICVSISIMVKGAKRGRIVFVLSIGVSVLSIFQYQFLLSSIFVSGTCF